MNWVAMLTIRARLIIIFSIIVILTCGMGGFAISALKAEGKITEKMYNHPLTVTRSVLNASQTSLLIQRDLRNLMRARVDEQAGLKNIATFSANMNGYLAITQERILGEEGQLLGQEIAQKWNKWHDKFILQFLDLVKQKRLGEAEALLLSQGTPMALDLDKSLNAAVHYAAVKADGFNAHAQTIVQKTTLNLYITLSVTILLIIFFAIVLTISIVTPLNIMVRTFQDIEKSKKIRTQVSLNSECELRRVSDSFNSLLKTVADLVADVDQKTVSLSQQNEILTNMAEESSANANTQQGRTEQVATAMNEMTASIVQVADMAENTANEMQAAVDECDNGQKKLSSCVQQLNQLSEESERVSVQIETLRQDTDNIGNVLDVINTIAAQTNLLALNAAIEAARAGEQGRGFAVVADEVRTLAQRTQDSTDEIRSTIESLQQSSQNSVNMMQQNNKYIETSVKEAREANETLAHLGQAVTRVNELNEQIAQSGKEQSTVSEEINANVHDISEGASHASKQAKQVRQVNQDLSTLVDDVRTGINQFDIT